MYKSNAPRTCKKRYVHRSVSAVSEALLVVFCTRHERRASTLRFCRRCHRRGTIRRKHLGDLGANADVATRARPGAACSCAKWSRAHPNGNWCSPRCRAPRASSSSPPVASISSIAVRNARGRTPTEVWYFVPARWVGMTQGRAHAELAFVRIVNVRALRHLVATRHRTTGQDGIFAFARALVSWNLVATKLIHTLFGFHGVLFFFYMHRVFPSAEISLCSW